MKILVAGDFHGKFPVRLRKAIKREELDLIIGLGDYAGVEEWRPYILHIFESRKKGIAQKSPEEFYGKKGFVELMKKDFDAGESILDFLSGLGVPFVSIFGNGDDAWYNYPFDRNILQLDTGRKKYLRGLKNFRDITYGVLNRKEFSILGFGGYVDAKENYDKEKRDSSEYLSVLKRLDKTEKRLRFFVGKLKRRNKIFVFHYPIKGVFDVIRENGNVYDGTSVGVDFFRDIVLEEKPALVLCGHMHEYQGKKRLGESLIVNPGAACDGKCAIIDFDKGKVRGVRFMK